MTMRLYRVRATFVTVSGYSQRPRLDLSMRLAYTNVGKWRAHGSAHAAFTTS